MKTFIKERLRNIPGLKPAYREVKHFIRQPAKRSPKKQIQFEVHLVEHCNLNCKGCDNFSCIAKKEFADVTTFQKDLTRLSQLFDKKSGRILLLGGEPLLHPQIEDFFKITRTAFPKSRIMLYTNGVLLRKMADTFWQTCAKNDIIIFVSIYPVDIKLSQVTAKANEFGARLLIEDKHGTLWKCVLDIEGRQDPQKNFRQCSRSNHCIALASGKLYTCSLIPNIVHFNRQFNTDLKISEADGIDIYAIKDGKEILRFLSKPVPFCRYCNLDKFTVDIKWEATKKKIEEWT